MIFIDQFFNPTIGLIAIHIILIYICVMTYIYQKHKYTYDEPTLRKKELNLLFTILIVLPSTIFMQYRILGKQGLENPFQNPYKVVQASKLAPQHKDITSIHQLNQLTPEEKKDKTIIVFRFGCIYCQELWLQSKQNKKLQPSDNVLWIPYTETNKDQNDLFKDITHFPAIIKWEDDKPQIIQRPTDAQLDGILSQIK